MGPAAGIWVLRALFHDVHQQCTLQLGHHADEVAKQMQRKPVTHPKILNWEVSGLEFSFKPVSFQC